jgi:hypothetical protein
MACLLMMPKNKKVSAASGLPISGCLEGKETPMGGVRSELIGQLCSWGV